MKRQARGLWASSQILNNPAAHGGKTTGPEIKAALGGANPDYIVAAAGTGGSVSGVAHFFNGAGAQNKNGLAALTGERVFACMPSSPTKAR